MNFLAKNISIVSVALLLPLNTAFAKTNQQQPQTAKMSSSEFKIVNLGRDYLKFWEAVNKQKVEQSDIETHVKLFKEHVIGTKSQFYMDVVFDKRSKGESLDDLLRNAFKETIPFLANYYSVISEYTFYFEKNVNEQIVRLKKALPDFKFNFPIYGMVSLNKFAGGVRTHEGRDVMAISFDTLAIIRRDFDMVFTHEAFHVYHKQVNPTLRDDLAKGGDLIIAGMFIEGIATYAEGALNPKRHDRRMVKELSLWCEKGLYKKLIPELLADNEKLTAANYEENKNLYRKWFYTARDKSYPFPTEAAYCIGDRVVSELAAKHSLQSMAAWKVPKLIEESKKVLKQWQ